jgi:hypothetical protein
MTRLWNLAAAPAAMCCVVLLMLALSSCSSDSGADGLPRNLPEINLDGGTDTPPHSMASYEYPFDSSGRYVTAWAAEGERRAGRSAGATKSDSSRWTGSHGGAASRKTTTKSKSGTSAKAKSKSSKGGRSYTVKKGDTLSAIASRHGSSVSKIKSANGMKSDFLSIGRVLRIP